MIQSESEVFDPLEELAAYGGGALVVEMIDLVLHTLSLKVREIEAGLDADDRGRIRNAAHSAKASAGIVGSYALMKIAATLQDTAATDDPPVLASRVRALVAAHREAERALRRHRSRFGG